MHVPQYIFEHGFDWINELSDDRKQLTVLSFRNILFFFKFADVQFNINYF